MAPIVLNEAQRLNIRLPEDRFQASDFPNIQTTDSLEYDIDDENKAQQKQNIVKIASEFLDLVKNFDQIKFYERYSFQEILAIVPDKVNEVEIRRYEMLLHNLQSSFDTYVIHGGFRFGNRKLKQLRGYFSVVFHLLQMVGRLLHFYERHLYEAGYKNTYKKVHDQLCALINPEQYWITRSLRPLLVCHFMALGRTTPDDLNEISNAARSGWACPKARLRPAQPARGQIVQHYGGQVELVINEPFDSSVLDIQWAAKSEGEPEGR
jgi:hypothetical protein